MDTVTSLKKDIEDLKKTVKELSNRLDQQSKKNNEK